ncbi:MAG: helix-turn-helix domain-containing protein, partial [Micrococcales bacterium]|nr:helix-turn-helix domain-containing protein [Micrococcales bacterium]
INPPTDPGSLARLRDAVSRTAPSAQIRKALIGVVDALAQGSPVRVEPVAQMVTTSQAAQMLNVSRTTLVKLLDDRKIPYEQPNVHRLVAVADVLAYREKHSSV